MRLSHFAANRLAAIALLFAFLAGSGAKAASVAEAEAALKAGRTGTALRTLEARIQEAPRDMDAHELRIDLGVSLGEANLLRDRYRALSDARPTDADLWYLRGRAEPDPADALLAFEKALSLVPDHPRAWMGKGAVERMSGRPAAAVAAYERALAGDPSLIEAWAGLRAAWLEVGDRRAVEAVSRRALEAAPEAVETWLALATLLPLEAPDLLTKAEARFPGDPNVAVALARALFENGKTDQAIDWYDRCLAKWPDAGLRAERALLDEIRRGTLDLEGARVVLEARSSARTDPGATLTRLDGLTRRMPGSAQARAVFGNILASQGRFPEAESALRAAVERAPDNPDLAAALGLFYAGQRKPGEALVFLDRALEGRPEDPTFWVAAAMARAEAGDPGGAEAKLRDAILRHPRSPGPSLALARLFLKYGANDPAVDVLVEALGRAPDPELFRALTAAARLTGRTADVADRLSKLGEETGDPRFAVAADGLRATAPPTP